MNIDLILITLNRKVSRRCVKKVHADWRRLKKRRLAQIKKAQISADFLKFEKSAKISVELDQRLSA